MTTNSQSLRSGWQAAEWGLQMMIVGGQRIREAERKAKQGKVGVWHDYVQPASAGTKLSDNFSGMVVEVVSGDVVCVKDAASGNSWSLPLAKLGNGVLPLFGASGVEKCRIVFFFFL
jgi:hypothetical protein